MVRLFIPILLIILGLASDAYIFHRYINIASPLRHLWWLPTIAIALLVAYLTIFGRGAAEDFNWVVLLLLLLMLFMLPKILFTPFALIPRIGAYIGGALAMSIICIVLWGITFGFTRLNIRHVTYESTDVPEAFDGYRIAQFTDAHTGVFSGAYKHLLSESIDSINALNADLICFVGDIENFSPDELLPHKEAYSRLKAKDGVLSIMGNHDYSTYLRLTPSERAAMERTTRELQKQFGWRLLSNEHITISRTSPTAGEQRMLVIGEENWGLPPFPQFGDLNKATDSLTITDRHITDTITGRPAFTLMLSHDPTAWREHILPLFQPNITLSGHTHGTQFSLFGWSPASHVYKEWGGTYWGEEYDAPNSMLSVSTGFGGNFPFRFGMPREVVVITLKHKK